MLPYIKTPFGDIATFVIMIAFGLIAFFYILHKNLKKDYIEESFIIPKVVCSMMVAYIGAGVVDSLFKMGVNGSFIISGITFYGGLIFGVASMWLQLLFYTNKTKNCSVCYVSYVWKNRMFFCRMLLRKSYHKPLWYKISWQHRGRNLSLRRKVLSYAAFWSFLFADYTYCCATGKKEIFYLHNVICGYKIFYRILSRWWKRRDISFSFSGSNNISRYPFNCYDM